MADALIAATALNLHRPLWARRLRTFPFGHRHVDAHEIAGMTEGAVAFLPAQPRILRAPVKPQREPKPLLRRHRVANGQPQLPWQNVSSDTYGRDENAAMPAAVPIPATLSRLFALEIDSNRVASRRPVVQRMRLAAAALDRRGRLVAGDEIARRARGSAARVRSRRRRVPSNCARPRHCAPCPRATSRANARHREIAGR